jgi:alkylated DNA repair dioxygenase AlkB
MSRAPHLEQPGLFGGGAAAVDGRFSTLRRIALDDTAWLDYAPGWVQGADRLFDEVLASREWAQHSRRMYQGRVLEPRLTSSPWALRSGAPLRPTLLEEMRRCLSERYGVEFDSVGFNFYRDGRDSVAWHGDKILREVVDPVVALVALGEPRRYLIRPVGGGRSRAFSFGGGDLLVTGGTAQRRWQHAVPKVAHAGPRISVAFRHGMDPRAYGAKRIEPAR